MCTLKGCFVETCHPDEIPTGSNVTDICPINNGIINLQNKTENLNKCLEQSDQNRGDVCKDCLQSFNDVSNHFDQLHSAPNGICFEPVDQVNSNRMKQLTTFQLLQMLHFVYSSIEPAMCGMESENVPSLQIIMFHRCQTLC